MAVLARGSDIRSGLSTTPTSVNEAERLFFIHLVVRLTPDFNFTSYTRSIHSIMAPDVNTLLSGRESTFKQDDDLIPLCHIVTPIGMLGYGFDEELNDAELARLAAGSVPTAIILDSGSTDSGPAKLALGSMTCPVSSYERDLKKLMALSTKYDVPLIFSSAGGDGTAKHVDELVTVVEDIVSSAFQGCVCPCLLDFVLILCRGTHTKIVAIYSDVDKTTVSSALRTNRIQG